MSLPTQSFPVSAPHRWRCPKAARPECSLSRLYSWCLPSSLARRARLSPPQGLETSNHLLPSHPQRPLCLKSLQARPPGVPPSKLPPSFLQPPPTASPAARTRICAGFRGVDGAPSFVLGLHHLADGTETGALGPAYVE